MGKTISIQLIKDFVDEVLNGDLEKLPYYDIKQLRGNKKYGTSKGRSFDPDNTLIARAIMAVVFDEAWPGLNEETMTNMDYRGDTINTFNTMFGPLQEDGTFQGLSKFNPDSITADRVHHFYSQYSSIGNIVPLPNKYYGRYTLNTFRGIYPKWRDYFDSFLTNLRQYLVEGKAESETYLELMKSNEYSFLQYKGVSGFVELCQKLMLEDYLNPDGSVKNIFPLVYWWNKRLTNVDYLAAVNNYLDFTEPFINKRGMRIAKALKAKLY